MFDTIPASSAGDFYAPSDTPQAVRHRPQFTGRAGEYFGIWFVNLLLSILTLGIYSAWAKVRTERYFYANTSLAGANFEYLASPIAILKGRLMAYAVVIALGVSSKFSPGLYLLLAMCVGLLLPALIVWSLRFRARNSAWRGLSFRFDNGAGEAYGPFLLWTWLSSITVSLLYPVMKQRQHQFVVQGHRLGTERFSFYGESGSYYGPYAIAVAGFVGAIIVLIVVGSIASDSGIFGKA
ncbi:MAG: YjgN family protein, partial [Lysobacter sp.]